MVTSPVNPATAVVRPENPAALSPAQARALFSDGLVP